MKFGLKVDSIRYMLTVGDLLRNARQDKNLSISDVEKKTKIRSKYLAAVEANSWTIFPSKVYITGIIRSYSKFLQIDPDKTLAYFRRDYERLDEVKFKKKISSLQLLPETRKLIFASIFIVCLLFFGYIGYQVKLYLAPPDVSIVSPSRTIFRNADRIVIVGNTQKDATVKIFNDTLYPDVHGRFEYTLPIKKGINTVKIEVTGANGKKNYILREFILE
jgi:transcriptional regulator with XRE-family HTH domain